MKTIYNAVLARLKEKVPALKWIDMDKGQLKKMGKEERPSVAYPCALVSIDLPNCKDITDTIQDCKAVVTVRLAFYPMDRTSADAPEDVREEALEPYDVIADVYAALQGFETDDFDTLSRSSQRTESHDKLFIYQQVFTCRFEDETAEE
jgi:hypothetical protein